MKTKPKMLDFLVASVTAGKDQQGSACPMISVRTGKQARRAVKLALLHYETSFM